jgi:hypothetical protein
MNNLIYYAILLILQSVFRAINDSIIHHDSFAVFGKYFSREYADRNKINWFHRYFPMFFDAWHLGIVLQTLCLVGVVFIATNSLVFVACILVARGLIFNVIYK